MRNYFLTDAKVPVRAGDRVQCTAGREPLYVLTQTRGELLLPASNYMHEQAVKPGTIRVKGGMLSSRVGVRVLSRGPAWK